LLQSIVSGNLFPESLLVELLVGSDLFVRQHGFLIGEQVPDRIPKRVSFERRELWTEPASFAVWRDAWRCIAFTACTKVVDKRLTGINNGALRRSCPLCLMMEPS
jgi:hypothetical protein